MKEVINSKIFLAAVIILALLAPVFITQRYYLQVLINCLIIAVAAEGLNLVMGFTGQACQCHPAFFGLGGYVVAIATRAGWNFWITLIFAGLFVCVIAACIGLLAFRTSGSYFAILSLCFGIIVYIVLGSLTDITGGYNGIVNIPKPPSIGPIDFSNRISQYYLVLTLLLITIFVYHRLIHSLQGLAFTSIRTNEDLAASTGINVFRTKMLVLVTSSFFTAIAGGISVSLLSTISPTTVHYAQVFRWFAYVLLGGMGTLSGPLVGSIVLPVIMEVLQSVSVYRDIIYGILIILCIIFIPDGFMGFLRRTGNGGKKKPDKRNVKEAVELDTARK